MASITSSPLSSAANNIIKTGRQSEGSLSRAQLEFKDFSRFLDIKRTELEKIELPSKKKIQELGNLNIVNTFGSAGNLLSSLFSGAFDIGNFISGFFPGKGEKIGKSSSTGKPQPKPQLQGGKLRLGGIRALGIANAVFSGLDFATGLAEGESVGKAGSGALGSFVGGVGGALAGTLLAGAIGQTLIPVPGLGFVLGALGGAAGSFLGGYGADRAYESLTEGITQKQESQLKSQDKKQKAESKSGKSENKNSFIDSLNRFNQSVMNFQNFVINFGNIMLEPGTNYENTNEGGGNINSTPSSPSESQPYDGPVDGESFYPLPGGILSTREVGVRGGEYGANRSYGGHSGQDIGGLPPGSPVVAWKTGKISYIGSVEAGDTILEIDHGSGLKSRYKHVVPTVPNGSIVYGGQQIATLFAAKAYDEHLHFEVWKNGSHTNPMSYLKAAQKIPGPLSQEKAKQNSEKSNTSSVKKEVGLDIYPQEGKDNTKSNSQEHQNNIKSNSQQQNQNNIPENVQPLAQQRSGNQISPQISSPQQNSNKSQEAPANKDQVIKLPYNISPTPKREIPKIQNYPSYSQGQSYIMEKQTIISSSNSSNSSSKPVIIPVGGGGGSNSMPISIVSGTQVLNSFMKSVLLTSLSAT